MRTRLTELLGIEHPVMLAGMGGVSYAELVAAVSEAGGFGCLGASTMGDEQMVAGDRRRARGATDKPFGVDLLTAMPGGLTAGPADHRGRGHRLRGRARRPLGGRRRSATATACSSSACAARSTTRSAAVEAGMRPRGRPGHRGRWAHRPGGDDAPRSPDRRRRRRPRAGRGGRRHLRRPRPGRRPGSRCRRDLGGHPLHRHPRGPRRAPATRRRYWPAGRTRPR